MVGELVESMECVKKCWINGFPRAKKENAYQLILKNAFWNVIRYKLLRFQTSHTRRRKAFE